MRLYIPLLVALFALWGCSSSSLDAVTAGGILAAETKAADIVLQSGDVEAAVLSAELDADAVATVIAGFDDYALSRIILTDVARSPGSMLGAMTTIRAEHARLREAYRSIQYVVETHWESYDPAAQAKLQRWRDQAHRLEGRYQEFIQAATTALTSDARHAATVELLRTVASIALVVA